MKLATTEEVEMSAGQPFGNVAIDPRTGNPTSRTTPEHKIKRIYARTGAVVIVGEVGGQDVESVVTRQEAIYRAQALSDMSRNSKYSSDFDELQGIVQMFIEAIKTAAEQEGKKYKSLSVAMSGIKSGVQ